MQGFSFASRVSASRVASTAVMTALLAGLSAAHAAELPAIKISGANTVPACATADQLQAYLTKRNPSLDRQFQTIASDYRREGETLGIRWDIAFFQMMLESGDLSFAKNSRIAGVKPEQNNLVGLKPIEKHASFESFPDVATGVRAHLQHVTLYSGASVANPVSHRTKRLAEMGMLAEWSKSLKHPVTFADLADKWTGGSDTYADRLQDIADHFTADFCNKPDQVASSATPTTAKEPAQTKVSGLELARRAIEGGAESRSGLGAGAAAGGAVPVKILNAPEPEAPAAPAPAAKLPVPELPAYKAHAPLPPAVKTAAVGAAAKAIAPTVDAPAKPTETPPASAADTKAAAATQPLAAATAGAATTKCRVFTASYGGTRAVIVKAVADQVANYTVLDVNEGQEAREADAFIAAYAKGGQLAGQFPTQDKALEKAFELCPEG